MKLVEEAITKRELPLLDGNHNQWYFFVSHRKVVGVDFFTFFGLKIKGTGAFYQLAGVLEGSASCKIHWA